MSPLVTVLITSIASILSVLVGGFLVHSRTRAETKKLAAEAENLTSQTADRVYNRIKGELEVALERADKSDERATFAERRADMLAARVYELYDLIDRHIEWDRMVAQILHTKDIEVPQPPKLTLQVIGNEPRFRTE